MKYIQLFIAITILCLFSSCKKDYQDGSYTPPAYLKIAGNTSVAKEASVDYATFYLDNASYEWSVTGDATVTAGQGTSKITVKFGTQNASVTVKAGGMDATVSVTVN